MWAAPAVILSPMGVCTGGAWGGAGGGARERGAVCEWARAGGGGGAREAGRGPQTTQTDRGRRGQGQVCLVAREGAAGGAREGWERVESWWAEPLWGQGAGKIDSPFTRSRVLSHYAPPRAFF